MHQDSDNDDDFILAGWFLLDEDKKPTSGQTLLVLVALLVAIGICAFVLR